MNIKIGVVKNYVASNYPEFLDFDVITRAGETYYKCLAFAHHIDNNSFDYTFESVVDYETWLTDFIYLVIPTDLIPELTSMAGMVDDVLTGEEFTVYLGGVEITTGNGNKKDVKTLPVSFTPCTVIEWEDGDDERLASIIEMFNVKYNSPRKIDFACKFDNRGELNAFIQSQI